MIETSLVHIYHIDAPGEFIGCGAMVEGGYIATCRHVWRDAGGDTREAVTVAFPRSLDDNGDPVRATAVLVDACDKDQDGRPPDLVLLRVEDTFPRGMELQIARHERFEYGPGFALAVLPSRGLSDELIDGVIVQHVNNRGLRRFTGDAMTEYWLEKGSSGSPMFLKGGQQLAGLVTLSELGAKPQTGALHEAFVVPGQAIWRCVSLAKARPVAKRENVDIGKLRELLANLGHDNVPATEIPAKLEESLRALRERGEKQAAPSNAGADIDATIAAARAKLRESDPQGALTLLKTKRAEETQARVRRETALLAEQAAVERLAHDYAGAKATMKELTRLDPDAVWRWIELGDLSRTIGNLAEASRAFHAALDAARRLGLARDEALALERLGDVLVQQGKLTDALQSYQAQLAIVERLANADPDNTMGQRDLSVSYNKIGNILALQGKLTDALRSFRDGLAIVERVARADPDNAQWQYDLGVSNERIGNMLVAQGDLAGAMQSYRVSLAITERLAQADRENAQWQFGLGATKERIGDVLFAQSDLVGAMESYRARHEIISRLAHADPGNMEWQRDLSVSHNKIGNVLVRQGGLIEALQSFRGGLAIVERLAQADRENTQWQYDLGVSNERIGDVLFAQSDLVGAMESYLARHEIISHLAKADPGNTTWQRDLSVSCNKIGDVLTKQGKLGEALQSYRKGLAIIERLAQADTDNAEWRRDLTVSCVRIAAASPGEARVMLERAQEIANRLRDEGKLAPADAGMPGDLARRLAALNHPAA
jgi:tetratricopeptide (TPR) repeat protein